MINIVPYDIIYRYGQIIKEKINHFEAVVPKTQFQLLDSNSFQSRKELLSGALRIKAAS